MIKKPYIYFSIVAMFLFIIGFSLAIYIQGREVEKQIPRLVIGDKLNLINSIATQIENNDSVYNFNFLFGVLCQQVSYLREEALVIGEPISEYDYPGVVVYSEKIAERYKSLSENLDVNSCNID